MPLGLLVAAIVAGSIPPGGVLPAERLSYDKMLVVQALGADKTFAGSACEEAKVEVLSIMPWKIADHPDLIVWRESPDR